MITIELDLTNILMAVSLSLVSAVISVATTWYFSKRHYAGVPRPITEEDILMQEAKNEFRFKIAGGIIPGMIVVGIFVVFILNIVTDCRDDSPEPGSNGTTSTQDSR